ncbi:MAG: T9SS type A sorting domain-containing protein [Bacteroidota bacterium]
MTETFERFSGEFRRNYDVSKIAKGVYVLEVISNERTISRKLVVK